CLLLLDRLNDSSPRRELRARRHHHVNLRTRSPREPSL
ncbi:unnamed protein product, partial [Brassica oleracea]